MLVYKNVKNGTLVTLIRGGPHIHYKNVRQCLYKNVKLALWSQGHMYIIKMQDNVSNISSCRYSSL